MKNHIFIGLGGQGGKTLAALRKVFEQRAKDIDELQQNYDWLYLDSSRDVTNSSLWDYLGKDLSFEEDKDFLSIKDGKIDVGQSARRERISPWIGEEEYLSKFLGKSENIDGANQRRRFGRLLFAQETGAAAFVRTIRKKVTSLTNNGQASCAFHIFASLAGGTGSGTILDAIALIREQYPDSSAETGYPIYVNTYITDDNASGADVGYFYPNQYCALRDLNGLYTGRFRPYMLYSNVAGGRAQKYDGNNPVNAHFLYTNQLQSKKDGSHINIDLKRQIQTCAESTFERIYCLSGRLSDPDAQKIATGQDTQASFPGEPIANQLRSYSFASSGMRKWEIPRDKIKEYIVSSLNEAFYKAIIHNCWNNDYGYVEDHHNDSELNQKLGSELWHTYEKSLIKNHTKPLILSKQNSQIDLYVKGAKKEKEENPLISLYEKFNNFLDEDNSDDSERAKLLSFKSNTNRIDNLRNAINGILTSSWSNKALPLTSIANVLNTLSNKVEEDITKSESTKSSLELYKQRMDKRLKEDEKTSILSKLFGKRSQMLDAHANDLKHFNEHRLLLDISQIDIAYSQEVRTLIADLVASTSQLIKIFSDEQDKEKQRASILKQELTNLQNNDSNKIELNSENIKLFLELSTRDSEGMSNFVRIGLNRIFETLSYGRNSNANIGDLIELKKGLIMSKFKSKLNKDSVAAVEGFHAKFTQISGVNRIENIFDASILDILSDRFHSDEREFRRDVEDFKDNSGCCLAIDKNQYQPKDSSWGADDSEMPKCAEILGLPTGNEFNERIIESLNVDRDKVYYHNDPTQIRMMNVNYWMAARFSKAVQGLKSKYDMKSQNDQQVKYFCNTDPEGEKDRIPSLSMPTVEDHKSRALGNIWIGTMIDPKGELIGESKSNPIYSETSEGLYHWDGSRSQKIADSKIDFLNRATTRQFIELNSEITGLLSTAPSLVNSIERLLSKEQEGILASHETYSDEFLNFQAIADNVKKVLQL